MWSNRLTGSVFASSALYNPYSTFTSAVYVSAWRRVQWDLSHNPSTYGVQVGLLSMALCC